MGTLMAPMEIFQKSTEIQKPSQKRWYNSWRHSYRHLLETSSHGFIHES